MAGLTYAPGLGEFRQRMPWWLLGQLIERSGNDEPRDAKSAYPKAAKIVTMTVPDAADNTVIAIPFGPVTVSYTVPVAATQADIGTGVAAAINGEPLVRSRVIATSSVDGVTLTLSGRNGGDDFPVAVGTGGMSALTVTQAAAAAASLPFARAVKHTGWAPNGTDELVTLASSTVFAAQVITVTPTFISGAVLTIGVYEVRGEERRLIKSISESSATSLAVTLAAALASLNAQLPAASVNVTGGATNLVFTAELAGFEFDVDVTIGDEGASLPTVAVAYTTGPNENTSVHRGIKGVSMLGQDVAPVQLGTLVGGYDPLALISYVRRGTIAVELAQGSLTGGLDQVFVELAPGDNAGKFYAAASATRVALSRHRAKWELAANADTGALAALRVTM